MPGPGLFGAGLLRHGGGRVILSSILQAIGLFLVTNIDDVIVLSLFFARGAGQRGTTARILAGQYLGFAGILGAAVLVSLGAREFLPPEVIPYFGLIPLGLGLWVAWNAWRGGDDDDDDDDAKVEGKNVAVWTVAGVTFANGGDNIGVYVPVFLSVGPGAVVAYCIVFLVLVAVLVGLAKFVATRRPIAEVLERWEHILFPIVLIGLGVFILISGGAFGL
ncbi:cadmium resistance transporter [Nesterenkonia jeotgali]